jgi:hypothetical protein
MFSSDLKTRSSLLQRWHCSCKFRSGRIGSWVCDCKRNNLATFWVAIDFIPCFRFVGIFRSRLYFFCQKSRSDLATPLSKSNFKPKVRVGAQRERERERVCKERTWMMPPLLWTDKISISTTTISRDVKV